MHFGTFFPVCSAHRLLIKSDRIYVPKQFARKRQLVHMYDFLIVAVNSVVFIANDRIFHLK